MPSSPKLVNDQKPRSATVVFNNSCSKISGHCIFTEKLTDNGKFSHTEIEVHLGGLSPGKHGFHIHESGNLLEGCKSCCSHFNPTGVKHGGPNDSLSKRHIGDLGNVIADKNGNVNYTFKDRFIRLCGNSRNIIGRSVVVHQGEDDLGRGGDLESTKTGNAGARIGCGVIGLI